MKGKKKSLLKNKSLVSLFLATFPHVCSTRNSSRVAVRRPKRGHDKTRSEGVARDIEVLRIQILFALQPDISAKLTSIPSQRSVSEHT